MISGKSFALIILLMSACRLSVLEEEWQQNLAKRERLFAFSPQLKKNFGNAMAFDNYKQNFGPHQMQLVQKLVEKFKLKFEDLTGEKKMGLITEMIQSTLDDRFGDLDEIEKKLSDLQKTPEFEKETAKAYFVNIDEIQSEIELFSYFENDFEFIKILDDYSTDKIQSLPTEYQFSTKAFGVYKKILAQKIQAYKERFGNIPEEVEKQQLELEKLPNKLIKSFGESVIGVNIMPKAAEFLFPLFKHEFLRVIREEVTDPEKIRNIEKNSEKVFRESIKPNFFISKKLNKNEFFANAFAEISSWSYKVFSQSKVSNTVTRFITKLFAQFLGYQVQLNLPLDETFKHARLFISSRYKPQTTTQLSKVLASLLRENHQSILYPSNIADKLFVVDLIHFAPYSDSANESRALALSNWDVKIIFSNFDEILDFDFEITETFGLTKRLFYDPLLTFDKDLSFSKALYGLLAKMCAESNGLISPPWNKHFDSYLDAARKLEGWKDKKFYFLFKILNLFVLNNQAAIEVTIPTLGADEIEYTVAVLEQVEAGLFPSILRTVYSKVVSEKEAWSLPLETIVESFSGKTLQSSLFNLITKSSGTPINGPLKESSNQKGLLRI